MLTIYYHKLEKPKSKSTLGFDPIYMLPDGKKSENTLKISTESGVGYFEEVHHTAGPWIMSQVMGNCKCQWNNGNI